MNRSILVTGPALSPSAMAFAAEQNVKVIPTRPYAPVEELLTVIAAEQPGAVIVRQGQFGRELIEAMPDLRIIAKHGVGYDTIDIQAAAERNIPVTIALGANAQSVAEHAFALMFSVARQVAWLDGRMRGGNWDKATAKGVELSGKTLGLIGLGSIGGILLDLVAPLNMQVRIFDPYLKTLPERPNISRESDFERLLEDCDVISLHCPLTADNRHLIGAAQLERMKPGSILINTARGELIDSQALIAALRAGQIGGAGLDTFEQEPPAADSALWSLANLVATPHVGANTQESQDRVGLLAVQQIVAHWAGETLQPRSVVNRHLLPTS